jgi:lysyl-tRNA synthetase class 2
VISAEHLRARAHITAALRGWFSAQGYLEVHTPTLVSSPAMEEHLEAVAVGRLFLHTSPEFAMKRVLAAGLHRIYQIAPCFREEEAGVHHSREFTLLEWYRAGAGTAELMDEVESLIAAAAQAIGAAPPVFSRIPVPQLLPDTGSPDDWFYRWVSEVEPRLTAPTIVFGYPPWQSALATLRGGLADRFEVYLGGIELANCFAEETDSAVLAARWEASNAARAKAGRPPHPVDRGLLTAIDQMPRCAGIALGLDRLVMALTGAPSIALVQVRPDEPEKTP